MFRRGQFQFVEQLLVALQHGLVVVEIHFVDGRLVHCRGLAVRGSKGDVVPGVEQHLHRLQQLVQIEAGREDLALLQVQCRRIGKHHKHVAGVRRHAGADQGCGQGNTGQCLHVESRNSRVNGCCPLAGHSMGARQDD
ncbi:hypothetical protein D3C76_1096440 [compost metagenome]